MSTTPTIKLVVIGASGVGKTSLRTQYISGRFSTNYRATIGVDFITKLLPYPTSPNQSVALQIWDTAGQERFSSLSSAFFRGADAVLLIFDVNDPHSLNALLKWWNEFRERAPLADEDVADYCCVVVGNKMDLVEDGGLQRVSEADALGFLEDLIPKSSPSPQRPTLVQVSCEDEPPTDEELSPSSPPDPPPTVPIPPRESAPAPLLSKSSPQNRYFSRSIGNGTIDSTRTAFSIYHTPSSSLFDQFHSARGSPEPSHSHSLSHLPPSTPSLPSKSSYVSITSSSSGTTITPSTFARTRANGDSASSTPITTPRDRGPRLFFTSARTGQGVQAVFEYVAKRVTARWEEEDRVLHVAEGTATDTVRLAVEDARRGRRQGNWMCCKT